MNKIKVEVIVNADIAKVWKFWNEPEYIKTWAFASDDWEAPYSENDLKTGGKFKTQMSAKDGSASFDFIGTYTEVEKHKKIAYVMSDNIDDNTARRCEVIFEDLNNGQVKITEIFDPENENSEELQRNGWQSILNNFKKSVEAIR